MPLLDLPISELKSYQGRNPKPNDYDQYWTKALAEMNEIKPDIKLDKGPEFGDFVKCQDLTFTGLGRARIYAKLLTPTLSKKAGPALIHFHGYSISSGDWSTYLGWVANGFTVAALDVRGQGGKSEDVGGVKGTTLEGHIIRGLDDVPDKLLYRSIFMDCAQLAKIVSGMPSVDPNRMGALGWSQGGGLALACAALYPKIARVAAGYPFLCDYQRVWEMDMISNAYSELRAWFKRHDPQHKRQDEVWNKLGYIDVQHLAIRIKAKTLMATGLMDDVCPPSTQFAAYNKIKSEKELLVFPDFGHEGLPGANDLFYQFLGQL